MNLLDDKARIIFKQIKQMHPEMIYPLAISRDKKITEQGFP